ncbi:hypothetical protein QVD17_36245 [Tagetes erecta]|uniref:RING-type E3 ubiquitin transferase n=1 Tax=Tagetes erecta TaxID=13708 RepID=A0AAD8JU85_TARER|nr:hypothetical protein QVD17_36245 [Tagetes erecta]
MNTTTTTGEPPYTAGDDTGNTEVNAPYSIGFLFLILFIVITLCYGSCIYKSGLRRSQTPRPQPRTATITNVDDHHLIICSKGLDDEVIVTFPTFVYSEAMMQPHKGDGNNSGCSVCLSEYKAADVVRLLPECGHLFHVGCIDTWLKVNATCPVCRNSPLLTV